MFCLLLTFLCRLRKLVGNRNTAPTEYLMNHSTNLTITKEEHTDDAILLTGTFVTIQVLVLSKSIQDTSPLLLHPTFLIFVLLRSTKLTSKLFSQNLLPLAQGL